MFASNKKIEFSRFQLIQLLILAAAAIFYMNWAYHISFNRAPDELMRYQIPLYIYRHGQLPTGYDNEVIYGLGNWSYAFYPQFLGAFISVFFMKIMSFVKATEFSLVFAARMTSVLFGLLTVYFTGKSIKTLTGNKLLSLFGMVLLGFLPQFVFLSSYVNNDIIVVSGASIIIYAMSSSVQRGWTFKNGTLLSIGFIVCALGYLNSYGFILCGGLFFLISGYFDIKKGKQTKKKFYQIFGWIFILTAVCVLPFFIRNFILYRDFLGMTVFKKEYMKWLEDGGKVLQVPYKTRGSLYQLLTDEYSNDMICYSFIGLFGYMSVIMGKGYYLFYIWIFRIGVIGIICSGIKNVYQKRISKTMRNTTVGKNGFKRKLLYLFVAAASLITIVLHVYYSYAIDYQPQGRYIMSILSGLVILIIFGLGELIDFFIVKKNQKYFVSIFAIIYIYILWMITQTYIYPFL